MKDKAILICAATLLASCSEKKEEPPAGVQALQAPTSKESMQLTTQIPPELIEGTPQPVRLPGVNGAPMMMSAKRPTPPSASYSMEAHVSYGSTMDFSNRGAWTPPPASAERYGQLADNAWTTPAQQPLSTFSIDVDTASYSNLRRMIGDGVKIPRDAVRLEEMVNYFDYTYPQPQDGQPFAVDVQSATCPWNEERQLVRVALKGKEISRQQRPAANLVFLLDVSGSMNSHRKLPLVLRSMRMLADQLNADDTLSIVVYAGGEGIALPATACDAKGRDHIASVLGRLRPGGSTNGEAGIHLAYKLARDNFKEGGINRVILATDGDFNVGVTSNQALVDLVAENALSHVDLTVIGVGTGNLNDSMMEAITNRGNGTYHYVDTEAEGRRVFLEKMMGTLVTIAKDVKIQVEFNPAQVRGYRLLGYANRMLKKEDFANDRVDAGDIGSGHTVTAFYEVEVIHPAHESPSDSLRYGHEHPAKPDYKGDAGQEWLHVKLRYKLPGEERSTLLEKPYVGVARPLQEAGIDFQFASSVAMAAMWMRDDESLRDTRPAMIADLAAKAAGTDADGKRMEFVRLMRKLNDGEPALRYRDR